jgi:outer membrane protein assembly factor BamB
MYHGNAQHTGAVAQSALNVNNVRDLTALTPTVLSIGSDTRAVLSVPALSDGYAYIGTWSVGTGGAFNRINLSSGEIAASKDFPVDISRHPPNIPGQWPWGTGFASSPAVVDGRVYSALIEGDVLCLDATSLNVIWRTNLVHADPAQQQYVEQGAVLAACWTSPLVINGRVYIGCGLGDKSVVNNVVLSEAGFGFIYCLDAMTGRVIWLFCTNQEIPNPNTPNTPNQIPPSLKSDTAPAQPPFSYMGVPPPVKGSSVWSSLAYDELLNRVYVGTGNDSPDVLSLPTPLYSNGLLALDATTGGFLGFFQPSASDSYQAGDIDVDMSGSPVLYNCSSGARVVGIGGKTGSFFLVRADNPSVVVARRQLLPYCMSAPDGHRVPVQAIVQPSDPGLGDGDFGIFSAAGIDRNSGRLFVGMGSAKALDPTTTPFVRALDWTTLEDAWPTKIVPLTTGPNAGDTVVQYDTVNSPFYTAENVAAVSSPAVSQGVVLVTTVWPAIYAFDAVSGECLWKDTGTIKHGSTYPLGPAILDTFVVVASGTSLYRWQIPSPVMTQDTRDVGILDLLLLSA